MIPSTVERVPLSTSEEFNERIRQQTEVNVLATASGDAAALDERLAELDAEWDIERTLEANAALVTLVGCGLAVLGGRKWFALPALVSGFLLLHALQGWCPPVPLFRRLGIRTQREIDHERYALKALRGDFRGLSAGETDPGFSLHRLMHAVRS